MNIFAMYSDPVRNAQALDDRRLNKLMIELSQMISTAFDRHELWCEDMCMPSFPNHPCTKWVGTNDWTLGWSIDQFNKMHDEWMYRGFNPHKHFYKRLESFDEAYLKTRLVYHPTAFINCAANDALGINFKHILDVHLAYRLYYAERVAKGKGLERWTNRKRPQFIDDSVITRPIYAVIPPTPEKLFEEQNARVENMRERLRQLQENNK